MSREIGPLNKINILDHKTETNNYDLQGVIIVYGTFVVADEKND